MSTHRILIGIPITARSEVFAPMAGNVAVPSLARLPPALQVALLPDLAVRAAVISASLGDVAIPAAYRWRMADAAASPSNPVWVSAADRNSRVVEILIAMDSLAAPSRPLRLTRWGGQDMTIFGAGGDHWERGTVRVPVLDVSSPAEPREDLVVLTEAQRRMLWGYLGGVLVSMRLRDGSVRAVGGSSSSRSVVPPGHALVAIGDRGHDATLDSVAGQADMYEVREDGSLRLDQRARMDAAEALAQTIRRHALQEGTGPVAVDGVPSAADFDRAHEPDDMTRRDGAVAVAGAVASAGGVVGSAWAVKKYGLRLPRFLESLLEGM